VKSFKQFISESIIKRGNKWLVTDSKGKKVLGTHTTKAKALKQLIAIELRKKQEEE
jgi:hypothetical protein